MVNKQNPEASPLEPTGSIARKAEPVTEVPGGYERMPNTTNGGAGTDQSGQAARTLPNEVVAANDGPALVSTDGDSAGTSAAAVVVNQGGDGAGTITDNGFDARRHPGEGQGDGSDVVGTRTTCDANEENNLIGNAIGDSDETPAIPKETKAPAPARSASMGLRESNPSAKAGATRKGRWALKYTVKCRFCGGKLCLRCSEQCALRCKEAAIHGLHSNWITDSIIAMQRPSSRLIKVYDIVGQFKRKGVTAILNLTEAGEHPYCGDGLEESSGFPYLPEAFMREGITFFNFAWEDMTTPHILLLRDIVRVAVSCIRTGGKIAIHCHAGYGRTGLVIASIVVMIRNLTAQQAVALVREKRPLSIQTDAQVSIVTEFANFVRGVRVVYHITDHARVTLGQHLTQQAFLLHGQESVHLRWLPKPVALATKMLVAVAREKPRNVALALAGVGDTGENSINEAPPPWGMAQEQRLKAMQYASNANDWSPWEMLIERCNAEPASVDPRIPAQLLYDWLEQLAAPAITVTELRRVLPQCALSAVLSDEDQEATVKTVVAGAGEGPFHRLNLLPVGQVRLLQRVTECLREVRDALVAAGGSSEEGVYQKACLRMAISLLHLHSVHEGLLVGRSIATDAYQAMFTPSTHSDCRRAASPPEGHGSATAAGGTPAQLAAGSLVGDLRLCVKAMELLVGNWTAPRRCRPYTKLEGLNNLPEVRVGNEDYWHTKRRSVVPPKDLIHGRGETDKKQTNGDRATVAPATGYTSSMATMSVVDTCSSWGAQDDAGTIHTSADPKITRQPLRRRSASADNMQDLVHLPQEDVGPLDPDHLNPVAKC